MQEESLCRSCTLYDGCCPYDAENAVDCAGIPAAHVEDVADCGDYIPKEED